jgi:prepilin-type N-terminal cleavage/methylation domain-containing protein
MNVIKDVRRVFAQKHRGFTLIELLATIAIIGILASSVIAALSTAREKSRDGKRIAQVRQVARALDMYLDSRQTYPSTTPSGFSGDDAAIQMLIAEGFLPATVAAPPGVDDHFIYHGVYGDPIAECDATAPSGTQCTSYVLGITLERDENIVLDSDADVRLGAFFGDSEECRTDIAGNEACYDISP